MSDRPKTVFKYESFSVRSLLNLKSQSLFFGSPRFFNDPYDCAITATIADPTSDQIEFLSRHYMSDPSTPPQIKKQLDSMSVDDLKKFFVKGATDAIKKERNLFLDTKGVTCFSECNDNLLMWAHYGGKYKGFCLEFNTDKEPFNKLHEVKYVNEMPQVDILDITVYDNHGKVLDDLFCTKSHSWHYEKEWRAIHTVAGTLFKYEPSALKAVYFGPDIECQALEIICLVLQGQNDGVRFYKSRRSSKEFKVEFRQFNYTSLAEARRKGLV